jgi:hypothetical protein
MCSQTYYSVDGWYYDSRSWGPYNCYGNDFDDDDDDEPEVYYRIVLLIPDASIKEEDVDVLGRLSWWGRGRGGGTAKKAMALSRGACSGRTVQAAPKMFTGSTRTTRKTPSVCMIGSTMPRTANASSASSRGVRYYIIVDSNNRRWCGLPVYRSGGVKNKQWDVGRKR